ncbi:hypothetical protein [Streptomyces sp. NPDC058398]|uniref:hypothetical protein n=1 Tax=Streptomyces sp. NPDC058398 TaxID=3346479 RepID=UPI00365DAFBB
MTMNMPLRSAPGTVFSAPGAALTSRADARLLQALRTTVTAVFGGDCDEQYTAPPVIARETLDRAGYPESFPHLLGRVHAAPEGGEPGPTDLALTPAACHHLYPLLAGTALPTTVCLGVEAVCFRAEATAEPGRFRSFRMQEIVRVGEEEEIAAWRDKAAQAAHAWLGDLGLAAETVPANDPFFGRPGRLLASAQRSQQLKWEMAVGVADDVVQAVASANCHKEHFGEAFGITDEAGRPAHSACLAFGLDRLVLALRHRHGPDADSWPAGVRARLSW